MPTVMVLLVRDGRRSALRVIHCARFVRLD